MAGESGPPMGEQEAIPEDVATRNEVVAPALSEQGKHRLDWETYAPQPTILTLQDLIDLPRQILPEQTYVHLQNAGKEAWLALTSLVEGLSDVVNNARRGQGEQKARKRINVE